MEKLSIIMPFLNEGNDSNDTILSILNSVDANEVEIIAINDASDCPSNFPFKNVKNIVNKSRIGSDACRMKGAQEAKTDNLFFIDAHMRFPQGWLPPLLKNIHENPKTLWCTTCVGLSERNMDVSNSSDYYRGADILLSNGKNEILEPKWRDSKKEGTFKIPCVLGANYGVQKSWFDYIHGVNGLKMWGGTELFMSLKSWMAGGDCKIDTNIKIGHKFRDRAPYSTEIWNLVYNKLFICNTIVPEKISNILINQMPKTKSYKIALKEINKHYSYIKSERDYYESIFTKEFNQICKELNINMPTQN